MDNRFIVSRSFLKFLVTINPGRIKVETILSLDRQSNVSNTFASAEAMIVERYLRQKRITQNTVAEVRNYYIERQWSITETTVESPEVTFKEEVAA